MIWWIIQDLDKCTVNISSASETFSFEGQTEPVQLHKNNYGSSKIFRILLEIFVLMMGYLLYVIWRTEQSRPRLDIFKFQFFWFYRFYNYHISRLEIMIIVFNKSLMQYSCRR